MNLMIQPGTLGGRVEIPASKSAAHRALLCAALADGVSTLTPFQPIKDILVTLDAIRALGADATLDGRVITVRGGLPRPGHAEIDCVESGSTLRFLVPLTAALGIPARFYGTGELPRRPLSPLTGQMALHGAVIGKTGSEILSVGGQLQPGRYELAGNISSQYITGLLLSLPLLEGDSELLLTSPLESKGYVDMTLDTLALFGVEVEAIAHGYRIPGGQRFRPRTLAIEGDYSGAAFWLCAGALDGDVAVAGLDSASLQGDREILAILRGMGANLAADGTVLRAKGGKLTGGTINVSQVPDLMPILAVTAALAEGETTLCGAARLRLKESDRLHAMTVGLQALGADVAEYDDHLVIKGKRQLRGGGAVSSFGDHRIAMAMTIAALHCTAPVTVTGAQCVEKSYPDFYRDLKGLGGEYHVL